MKSFKEKKIGRRAIRTRKVFNRHKWANNVRQKLRDGGRKRVLLNHFLLQKASRIKLLGLLFQFLLWRLYVNDHAPLQQRPVLAIRIKHTLISA